MKGKMAKTEMHPAKRKGSGKAQENGAKHNTIQTPDAQENGAKDSIATPEAANVSAPGIVPPLIASCVENGVWTGAPDFLPYPDPDSVEAFILALADVAATRPNASKNVLTFHATGCSANFEEHTAQQAVAAAMTTQLTDPTSGHINTPAVPASFLYLLGDVVYKPTEQMKYDQGNMYHEQFYTPYSAYNRPIFAIAGNHDGKIHFKDGNPANQSAANVDNPKTALTHFFKNFCSLRHCAGQQVAGQRCRQPPRHDSALYLLAAGNRAGQYCRALHQCGERRNSGRPDKYAQFRRSQL